MKYDPDTIVADVHDFFTNGSHELYHSKRTASEITPESVYHIRQLQVLFEDRYVHKLTYNALDSLNGTLLTLKEFNTGAGRLILVWRKNVRYVQRQIDAHLRLVEEYASPTMNEATGQYAELLTELGLSKLDLTLIDRDARTYNGTTWTATGHDLDYIMAGADKAYGIEVKNTYEYMPLDEFKTKLKMCEFLGLTPLFIVRVRHPNQWKLAAAAGGFVFQFKTKIFPPGQQDLVSRIWLQMKLPVDIWRDWKSSFYRTLHDFLTLGNNS